MNKSSYYLYNNIAITTGTLMAMLNSSKSIDLAKTALFLPLLLDDSIVSKINEKSDYNFENIVSLNALNISNYNERYRDMLPLLMNALSILLDMEAISLRKGVILNLKPNICDSMLKETDSRRLRAISIAADRLIKVTQNMDVSKMYFRLNIEL
ncbi:MAG: three component ABC system middle component [Dysgonomonas sp.]|nr:three component ABC system middle component [Dysgonomonas sp.]